MISGFIIGLAFGAGLVVALDAFRYLFSVRRDRVSDLEFHWRKAKTDVARPGSAEHFHRVFGHPEK